MTLEQSQFLILTIKILAAWIAVLPLIALGARFMAWRLKRQIMREEGWTSQEFDETFEKLKRKGLL